MWIVFFFESKNPFCGLFYFRSQLNFLNADVRRRVFIHRPVNPSEFRRFSRQRVDDFLHVVSGVQEIVDTLARKTAELGRVDALLFEDATVEIGVKEI